MHRYTIAGTTHIAERDRLYVPRDEEHGLEDIDPGEVYLHDDHIVKIRHEFTNVTIIPIHVDASAASKEVIHQSEFDGAVPVDSVTPDGVRECPECDGWLGPKDDDPDDQICFNCGHGARERDT